MKDDVAIRVQGIGKKFRVPHEKHNSLKSKAVNIFGPRKYTEFQALDDISFEVKKGEFFGIVGKNGSGKSTLLKILANIYQPSAGDITINGSLAPFIELGVGFNMELTGRENVFLSGTILGLTRKKIEAIYEDIVAFAEIEEFMDQKLKNYSSGMQVRLAFSIAVRAESDILLIDEVLAVGDAAFQAKCFDYFRGLKANKKTVVFVTHDMLAIKEYCDRALLINNSRVQSIGDPSQITDAYFKAIYSSPRQGVLTNDNSPRVNDGSLNITSCRVVDPSSKKQGGITDKGLVIDICVKVKSDIINANPGVLIHDQLDRHISASSLVWAGAKPSHLKAGKEYLISFAFEDFLEVGQYKVSFNVANSETGSFYLWADEITGFHVKKDLTGAIVSPPYKVTLKDLTKK